MARESRIAPPHSEEPGGGNGLNKKGETNSSPGMGITFFTISLAVGGRSRKLPGENILERLSEAQRSSWNTLFGMRRRKRFSITFARKWIPHRVVEESNICDIAGPLWRALSYGKFFRHNESHFVCLSFEDVLVGSILRYEVGAWIEEVRTCLIGQ